MAKRKKTELAGLPSRHGHGSTHEPSKNLDLAVQVEGDKLRDAIVVGLAEGLQPFEIAAKIYPDDPKKRKAARKRIIRAVQRDERLAAKVHEAARGEALVGLIPAIQGLARRASRGRPDAIKPLMAVTKFHDPSVKHEHTGEIKITMEGVPRPKRIEAPEDEEVIDAEVVDES